MGADRGKPEAPQIRTECTAPQWPLLGHRAVPLQPHCFWTGLHSSSLQDKWSQLPTVLAFPGGKELACYSHKDFGTQSRRTTSNIWCGIAIAQSLGRRLLSSSRKVMSGITGGEGLSWRLYPVSHMQGLALEKLPSLQGANKTYYICYSLPWPNKCYLLPSFSSAAGNQQP